MSAIDRSDPIILGHVLAEHRELFTRMQTLKKAFADHPRPTDERFAEIRAAVVDLRDHLRTHFEQEEQGGFLEESIARMPRLAAAATAIVRQHPALLAELDALIARMTGDAVSRQGWAEAGRDFEHFAATMWEHERSENTVVQEGYNEDLGLLD
ncbi:MAG: hypothetical protein EBR28_13470 [Planctomycetia bacterium]|nr:hypothetical protein [Planctomycetia bacterium]